LGNMEPLIEYLLAMRCGTQYSDRQSLMDVLYGYHPFYHESDLEKYTPRYLSSLVSINIEFPSFYSLFLSSRLPITITLDFEALNFIVELSTPTVNLSWMCCMDTIRFILQRYARNVAV
jgi:hypothetical protein